MACHEKEKILTYLLEETPPQAQADFKDHLRSCEECNALFIGLKDTADLLRKRKFIQTPAGLTENCIRRIQIEHQKKKKQKLSGFRHLLDRLPVWPEPVRRWAFIILVFGLGLGMGKVIFNPPSWVGNNENVFQNVTILEDGNENRKLHNYLLSVETLFLNLSNMDDSSLLSDDEWEIEMDITRKILHRTRQMKRQVQRGDNALFHLVTEIEWVLEDIIGTAEINLAGLSEDVRETIEKQQLLTKIHGFIS